MQEIVILLFSKLFLFIYIFYVAYNIKRIKII